MSSLFFFFEPHLNPFLGISDRNKSSVLASGIQQCHIMISKYQSRSLLGSRHKYKNLSYVANDGTKNWQILYVKIRSQPRNRPPSWRFSPSSPIRLSTFDQHCQRKFLSGFRIRGRKRWLRFVRRRRFGRSFNSAKPILLGYLLLLQGWIEFTHKKTSY